MSPEVCNNISWELEMQNFKPYPWPDILEIEGKVQSSVAQQFLQVDSEAC